MPHLVSLVDGESTTSCLDCPLLPALIASFLVIVSARDVSVLSIPSFLFLSLLLSHVGVRERERWLLNSLFLSFSYVYREREISLFYVYIPYTRNNPLAGWFFSSSPFASQILFF